ncbi:hypothetical protein I203_101390 [Kwoniella mangroviensis CBS 8507]|uniref:uncharacterized protein n=1 Tax=Kwoniella mangroviensis CBS 8507 TaxID=1296122 RepID=UPI00080D00DB|nr:uncharacterized protein I203_05444 [Kwoniella mangroviensis CBS 8507]OCF65199.1 hypothetical protein I203_05444 [Kwoniella mangroviensis CBS 8507]
MSNAQQDDIPASRINPPLLAPNGLLAPGILPDGFKNARQLVEKAFWNPLLLLTDDLTFFPNTRSPDAHTIAMAYALCQAEEYPEYHQNLIQNERFPYIQIDMEGSSFDPNVDIHYKETVPIDSRCWPQLFYSHRNYVHHLLDGRYFTKTVSEEGQQGFMAMEEGDLLTMLLVHMNDEPVFFQKLSRWLNGMYWIHEHSSNFLTPQELSNLFSAAAENRKSILEECRKPYTQDPLHKKFKIDEPTPGLKKTNKGKKGKKEEKALPDHLLGRFTDPRGIAIFYVQEKRAKPGSLKDLVYYFSKFESAKAYLGPHYPGIERPKGTSLKEGIWVGSPCLGHWYARIFWQLQAEGHAHHCPFWILTDRFYTLFGQRMSDNQLRVLHCFSHVPPDDMERVLKPTPIEIYWNTGEQTAGLLKPISQLVTSDEYGRYEAIRTSKTSNMSFLEMYLRVSQHAAAF